MCWTGGAYDKNYVESVTSMNAPAPPTGRRAHNRELAISERPVLRRQGKFVSSLETVDLTRIFDGIHHGDALPVNRSSTQRIADRARDRFADDRRFQRSKKFQLDVRSLGA